VTDGESTTAPAARLATSRHDEILTERETVLRWDGHKDVVHLFTAAPTVYRKLCGAGYGPTGVSRVKGRECGWRFQIPYLDLRWGARPRKTGPTPGSFRGRRGPERPPATAPGPTRPGSGA
jgi:hypothetical protein